MTYLSDISLIREELITLIKIHNHVLEEQRQYKLRGGSQEFYGDFNMFIHTTAENVMIAIDLQLEKIEKYENDQSKFIDSLKDIEESHPIYAQKHLIG